MAPFPPLPPSSSVPATTLAACPKCSPPGKIDPSRSAAGGPDRRAGGRGDRAVLRGSAGGAHAPRGGSGCTLRPGTAGCSTRVPDHSAGRSRTAAGTTRTTACAALPRAPRPGPPKRWTSQLTDAIRGPSTPTCVCCPALDIEGSELALRALTSFRATRRGKTSTASPPRRTTATTKRSDFYGSR